MSLDIYLNCESGESHSVFEANITHNVSRMWDMAGVYDALYKSRGKLASQIIDDLAVGIRRMEEDMPTYRNLNPENGWGSADGALAWLKNLITACKKYPNSRIEVWA
jgi:hypothetical protein